MIVGSIIGTLIALAIGTIVYSFLIWIVGKLGLGLTVDGFGPAVFAALLVSLLSMLIGWLVSTLFGSVPDGGWLSALYHLLVAAIVLQVAGNQLPGIQVKGFVGALVAAIGISVVAWLLTLGLSMVL